MGKNHEKEQNELINLAESIDPDRTISFVRKIHEQFTNFIHNHPEEQLLPKFNEELKFIEDVIKQYETLKNNIKGSEPIHIDWPFDTTSQNKEQNSCSNTVRILKSSGDQILKTLNVTVPENSFISKVIITINSLTSCVNTNINIFYQNNECSKAKTNFENDFVLLGSSSYNIGENVIIEVKASGDL